MDQDVLRSYSEPALEVRPEPFPWLNVVLFIATGFSTLVVGTFMMVAWDHHLSAAPGGTFPDLFNHPSELFRGLPFSITIMSILLAHEMGHYLTCRYYGISSSLPYFIPFPSFIGTLGAFIQIRSDFKDRSSLLEVGVAGPIAGFVLSVPILALAFNYCRFGPTESVDGLIHFGEPLIYKILAFLMGVTPPPGEDVYLHPVGFAAWVGLFMTALNLLPIGQLDGGHIAYALFGRFHKRISQLFLLVIFLMGVFLWPGWLVWILLLALLGTRHPPTLNDKVPLGKRQVLLGWFGVVMLVLCFIPAPITIS